MEATEPHAILMLDSTIQSLSSGASIKSNPTQVLILVSTILTPTVAGTV